MNSVSLLMMIYFEQAQGRYYSSANPRRQSSSTLPYLKPSYNNFPSDCKIIIQTSMLRRKTLAWTGSLLALP